VNNSPNLESLLNFEKQIPSIQLQNEAVSALSLGLNEAPKIEQLPNEVKVDEKMNQIRQFAKC